MKSFHVYNGIYYAWETTKPIPPNAIMCKSVKLYQLWSEFIKIKSTKIGSFRFNVMDSPI